jgi:hypothetical protein
MYAGKWKKGLAEKGHLLVAEGLGLGHDERFELVVEVPGQVCYG